MKTTRKVKFNIRIRRPNGSIRNVVHIADVDMYSINNINTNEKRAKNFKTMFQHMFPGEEVEGGNYFIIDEEPEPKIKREKSSSAFSLGGSILLLPFKVIFWILKFIKNLLLK